MTRDPKVVQWQGVPSIRNAGGGSGGGGGAADPMDVRVKSLEIHLEHIRDNLKEIRADVRDLRTEATRDFRLLFAAVIFVALGLATLMAKGFHWL